ncbi:MAG: TonB-dependent receptor [Bacteroidales bacterium]|nr:TonB-dependent receptor [Bacteroidales bacterium]
MKKILFVLSMLIFTLTAGAQTRLVGTVKVSNAENPLPGVTVSIMQQNFSTLTNASGEFVLTFLQPGDADVHFSRSGYLPQVVTVHLAEDKELDMGTIYLKVDIQEEARQEAILQLTESDFDEDEGRASQSVSATLAKGDVYLSQTSYNFSPMRFRMRGYEQEFESTYVNGVHFNTLDRGLFNYSSLGGLNNANRNKDIVMGLEANSFSYGNLGTNTNILNRATNLAAGTRASVAYSNRAYKLRGQATYATGLMPNGWALAVSGVVRWADEGIVQGTFYNSAGYFLAAEKVLNPRHSLSLVTYGAPTRRAQQSAGTQEVFDLAGSIYYNSYWGYQDGIKRNSRVVKSYDPTVILNHEFKISETQRLRTGAAFHYSKYSNSAIGFYNAPDPRPDYYRNLPSFQSDKTIAQNIASEWAFENGKPINPTVSQVDWESLYQANYRNNASRPDASAKYVVERRHIDLMEAAFNSTYMNQFNAKLKLTAGIEAKYGKNIKYKTMDDLLGGNQWIDIDQFAERDMNIDENPDPNKMQNDLNNPNRVIKKGDIFGYHYDINILHASAFLQNEWNLSRIELYYAGKVTYTQYNRYGHMRNGRAPENSYGAGKTWWFIDPSLKAGATYNINGRNKIYANVLAETRAPLPNGAYVSERIKDTRIPYLQSRKILSYDLNYAFLFPSVRGRISGFRTHILGSSEKLGYYDDALRTFINHMLMKSDKIYQGVELGVSVKLNSSFSISSAATFADYHYTNNAVGVKSYENGFKEDIEETVLTKGLKINTGPQLAANLTLDYFHPKMWFADITLNYFDNNYLDFAPNRFTESNMKLYEMDQTGEAKQKLGTQEKLKGGFLLDASLGKVIYLPDRRSMNINLSFSNILNNTQMITGGYQQGRMPLVDGMVDTKNLNRFPNKYYYAWGFNMFLNLGFRF